MYSYIEGSCILEPSFYERRWLLALHRPECMRARARTHTHAHTDPVLQRVCNQYDHSDEHNHRPEAGPSSTERFDVHSLSLEPQATRPRYWS